MPISNYSLCKVILLPHNVPIEGEFDSGRIEEEHSRVSSSWGKEPVDGILYGVVHAAGENASSSLCILMEGNE